MSLKNFYAELSKGFPSAVYLISASDDFLLYECQALIKENQMASDPLNFSLHDLDPSETDSTIKEIVAELNTLPFFGEKKTVLLKNLHKIPKKDIKELSKYLLNPLDSTLLIMFCAGDYKKIFDTEILKKIKIISIQNINLTTWIQEKAKWKGIEIAPELAEYLIGTVGDDLAMLNSEIEKLSLLGSKVVDVNDIKEIVYHGADFSAFDLAKALQKGEPKTIFKIYYCIEKNVDPLAIIGALNWHYRSQYDRAKQSEKEKYYDVFKLIHEADVAQKSSQVNVVENLLIRILQLGWKM